MILVTGTSGHLGRLVVDALLDRISPSEIVAGARSIANVSDLAERGVHVRTVDYDRPDTLGAAFDGVDTVLLVSSSEVGRRAAQHQTVIDAARAAGVSHLAYTSILRADTSPMLLAAEHLATERAIEASGLAHTFLRNGWYIENYTANLAPALEHGTLVGSAGTGRIAAATRSDYAAAAAQVLTSAAHERAVYELAGNPFTMYELAAAVSAEVGRSIGYTDLAPADYRAVLVQAGVPEGFADVLVDADVNVARGQLDAPSTDLASLLGRPLTPLPDAIRAGLAATAVR